MLVNSSSQLSLFGRSGWLVILLYCRTCSGRSGEPGVKYHRSFLLFLTHADAYGLQRLRPGHQFCMCNVFFYFTLLTFRIRRSALEADRGGATSISPQIRYIISKQCHRNTRIYKGSPAGAVRLAPQAG